MRFAQKLISLAAVVWYLGLGAGISVSAPEAPAEDIPLPVASDVVLGAPWSAKKATLQQLGERYPSAEALYAHFSRIAAHRHQLNPAAMPDWSGVYERGIPSLRYDPDQNDLGAEQVLPTAHLTPAGRKQYDRLMANLKKGIEYDEQLSSCLPAGVPRWFTEPYLRDFSISPGETWLMNELANETRRVYTDGRDHPAPIDRYPLFDGDSIGFWDADGLVIHTNSLTVGNYQRTEPDHTANAELVEVWRKVDPQHLVAYVWVYDPKMLAKPWFTRQWYTKNPDKAFRINYYDCVGTPNTRVIKTRNGGSTFEDLNFDKDDKSKYESSPSPPTSTKPK